MNKKIYVTQLVYKRFDDINLYCINKFGNYDYAKKIYDCFKTQINNIKYGIVSLSSEKSYFTWSNGYNVFYEIKNDEVYIVDILSHKQCQNINMK